MILSSPTHSGKTLALSLWGSCSSLDPAQDPIIDEYEAHVITKLFDPISLGPMPLANRVVMTGMHLNYTPNGEVTDKIIGFYRARARGGVGLIIVGGVEIDDEASGIDSFLSIKDDKFIPGLNRLTQAIHEEGGKVAVQLYMAGTYSFCGTKGIPVLAPSEYVSALSRHKTTAMTLADIERVQDDFVRAGTRARQAGFDAVEVLAAGYLIRNSSRRRPTSGVTSMEARWKIV